VVDSLVRCGLAFRRANRGLHAIDAIGGAIAALAYSLPRLVIMRTGENAVLRWDEEPTITMVRKAANDVSAPSVIDASAERPSKLERAAMLVTIFVCFQFAVLAFFGL
jgi:hypothetical protein